MATEEVGIRLSLQGRREAAAGLSATSKELEQVADTAQDVDAAGRDAARGLAKASDSRFAKGFASIARGARGVAGALGRGLVFGAKAGAVAVGALSVAAAGLSVKAIGLASDAAETGSAFNTVFGPAARGVQKDLDKLTTRFGLYNPEMQDAARQFGVFGKAAGVSRKDLSGFSTDLVKAGLDLGSFYNADPGEVFGALQSGLSGESEPLRQFGIFLSDASLNAFAAAQGIKKTTQEMTDQEKVALRQAFILKNLGDAQGDLARTSTGFANQQRSAGGRTKEFLKLLGGPLMTAGTGAFRGLNSVLKVATKELTSRMPAIEAGAQRLSKKFARLGKTWAKELPDAIGSLGTKWDELKVKLGSFGSAGSGEQLGVLKDNLLALGPALKQIATSGVGDTLTVLNVTTGFLADHTDELTKAMPFLIAGFIALKVAQLAANIVLAASLPMKIAEFVVNRQLVASNRALVASRVQVTTATVANTGAVGANTAAESRGILTRARSAAGMVLMAAKTAIVRGATMAWTAIQWVLNAALTANPIGLVVAAIALLVGGVILAYKKSDTFRGIVDKLWAGLKVAWDWIKKVGVAVGTWIVEKFQAAVGKVGAVRDTIAGLIDKVKSAVTWLGDLGDKITNLPGMGLLGDVAGGIGGIFRAGGGPVAAGNPYIVGERRAELFVPKVDGMILPEVPRFRSWDDDDSAAAAGAGMAMPAPQVNVYVDGKLVEASVTRQYKKRLARA